MRAVHPGEVLREEYLNPMDLSVNALARELDIPATRIHEIVNERRGITADTATRLAQYFGGDASSWMQLQAMYDLKTLSTREEIYEVVVPRATASKRVQTVVSEPVPAKARRRMYAEPRVAMVSTGKTKRRATTKKAAHKSG
jgi:addiction module HigA family antidote